jgi:hypothetical protein
MIETSVVPVDLVQVPEARKVSTIVTVAGGTEPRERTASIVQIGEVGGSVSVGGARTNLYDSGVSASRKILARPEASRMMGFVFAVVCGSSDQVSRFVVVPAT